MLELLQKPWHWAVTGLLIGLTVPTLLILDNKKFGISSSLRQICAMCIPSNIAFFKYDWKKQVWNLYFVAGVTIGGFIAGTYLTDPNAFQVADNTKQALAASGITNFSEQMPVEIFSLEGLFTLRGFFFFIVGGFIVGFGTRYAGGCTSGHSIMGLSNLQLPSLIATICFMAGGFLSANLILPYLLKL